MGGHGPHKSRPAGGRRDAGFSDHANELRDIPLVPRPAVTILFDLGDEPFVVEDGTGSRQRDRVVAGLAPHRARTCRR
ncbi:MAG TPA: hypothetical protein VGN37_22140 [Actinocatenispora sp.]